MMDINRRKTLAVLCSSAAMAALPGLRGVHASTALKTSASPALGDDGKIKHAPLPYAPIDPLATADRAYDNYYLGECMYAVFASVVEELAEKFGEPFLSYPTSVTRYGAGGVTGWASLCGALNGSAMAIYLVSRDPDPAIDDVLGY
jgi:hypothetical protein